MPFSLLIILWSDKHQTSFANDLARCAKINYIENNESITTEHGSKVFRAGGKK